MRILITTGVYPPRIGGPAQYAKNLNEIFGKLGHKVSVKTFNIENYLPTGIRHAWFLFKIVPNVLGSSVIFALDTFSVGLPSVLAAKIFRKKFVIRTGGDFLWEQYVERTKRKILLREFYKTEQNNFTFKEKIIFKFTKWTLKNASHVVFSTDWQRQIFKTAYGLDLDKTSIIENYYGPKVSDFDFDSKTFVASTRKLVWKGLDVIKKIFNKIQVKYPEVELFTDNLPYKEFMIKMTASYAIVLVSLGDISPNMIMDAIRLNRPFICTREVGIYDRIKDAGIFADPLNEKEIEKAILLLLTEEGYREAKEKVRKFNFVHTWEEIADEFLTVYKKLK